MNPTSLKKQTILMDQTACSIKGVTDTLRVQIQILSADIKACEKSKAEFQRHLTKLETRRDELQARIKANEEWSATYDIEVGPFANRYNEMTGEIGKIYDKAKQGHARGIVLLEKEFGYHPSFKHPGDTFTAIPFRPI